MIDSHSHTSYSKHATGTVDELVRASIAAGVTILTITDHAPFPVDTDNRKRLANTPPRFFQLAAWCPPVFGGHHFKPLAEDLPCQANAAP
ncbi:PHP domain-containing protein, partial [Pseudomonas aeruginosa]|uniref:PHP domain-containing protein n=1 Tax=Pseudomonas aeruginosa TaxID=287 RepID=UPI0031B7B97C